MPKHRRDRGVELDQLVALVVLPDRVAVGDILAVGARSRRVQRHRFVRLDRLQRVDHVLDVELEVLGQLIDRRGATVLAGETLLGVAHLQRALLSAARNVNGPARVAEVAAHLAKDRRHRERRERMTAIGVVSIHGLQQPQRRDLEQILERLRRTSVAACQAACERHVQPYQSFTRGGLAVSLPAHEQLPRLIGRARSSARCRIRLRGY